MERRHFFGWMGKVALLIGIGSLIGRSEDSEIETGPQRFPGRLNERRIRMSGRACHDYRMISSDRSMRLDREIFGG
jgi:hypothetical protein